jgi:hypothetical protein
MTKDFFNYAVSNFYSKRNNNELLPNSIRACIIGKSGCGKTNLLMNLLLQDYLDYNNLYIFSTTLYQPLYQILISGLTNGLSKKVISECILKQKFTIDKKENENNCIQVHCFDDYENVPDPKEIDPNLKTLIIFDDIMLEKQNKVENYYTRDRHNNVDCFYISQNYIKLPKNTIRENANLFIIFPQDQQNLSYIYRDHCGEIDKVEFSDICKEIWSEKYNFITIDKTSDKNKGKFRKQLKYFYLFDD